MTWERLQAVEFSFLTLADSGAFLTHAPAKLSETLAIIRPFQWEVRHWNSSIRKKVIVLSILLLFKFYLLYKIF